MGETFSEWLRNAIREAGMGQNEFARRLGVGSSTVSRWIAGARPHRDNVPEIAQVLGVPKESVFAALNEHEPLNQDNIVDISGVAPEDRPLVRQMVKALKRQNQNARNDN